MAEVLTIKEASARRILYDMDDAQQMVIIGRVRHRRDAYRGLWEGLPMTTPYPLTSAERRDARDPHTLRAAIFQSGTAGRDSRRSG
jgi:hypothetical protein